MAATFPPVEAATKIAVSLAVGLLVGLEREWAHKELGVRTFALASLLGMLAWLVSPAAALVALAGAVVLAAFVNAHSFLVHRTLEITTSVALLVTVVLGVLIGQTHYFTAVASALVMTGLLAWKTELAHLAGDLRKEEIRGAVLLGLLAFVIYPLLPNRYIDRWHLLNPREAWLVVVVLAGIGFLNYALLRVWGARGLYSSAVLGGLVNSTATVAQISRTVSNLDASEADLIVVSVLLATGAMMARNLVILAIFAPPALRYAFGPVLAMAAVCFFFAWRRRRRAPALATGLPLGSPVSLPRVGALAAIFVIIEIVAALAERRFGSHGLLAVGFLGGLVSSASTTAAAAVLSGKNQLTAQLAASAAVIASVASALAHIPLMRGHETGRRAAKIVVRVIAVTIVVGFGLLVLSVRR
ncbi:MAG TPA: MgtC/SapB family protein [Patescibacteria group bacterium]|nr:MgtC/SapB family protein [Patescibacteria group bacterium]